LIWQGENILLIGRQRRLYPCGFWGRNAPFITYKHHERGLREMNKLRKRKNEYWQQIKEATAKPNITDTPLAPIVLFNSRVRKSAKSRGLPGKPKTK